MIQGRMVSVLAVISILTSLGSTNNSWSITFMNTRQKQ